MDYYDNLRALPNATFTTIKDAVIDEPISDSGGGSSSSSSNINDGLEDWHTSHVVEIIDPATNTPVRLCHLSALLALTTFGSMQADADDVATVLYMAIDHFNKRQSLAVPFLSSSENMRRCNVRFTADLYDCENSASKISQQLTHDVLGDKIYGNPLTDPVPVALVGANWSSVTAILSKLSSAYKLPQISHYASSVEFDSKAVHPFFSRTLPSNEDLCAQYVGFIRTLNVNHLGIIYDGGSFGTSMYKAIEGFALEQGIDVVALPVSFYAGEKTTRDIQFAIRELAKTKFRYFFGVVFDMEYYDEVMLEAHKAGIATPQHSWWFPDGIDPEDFQRLAKYPPDSPLVDAMKGVTFVHLRQPHFFDRFAPFQEEWNSIRSNPDAIAYIKSKRPTEDLQNTVQGYDPDSYDTSDVPGTHMRLLYDAVIALGIAACQDSATSIDKDNAQKSHYFFDGEQLLESLQHLHMDGATDSFKFNLQTGSRSQMDQKMYSISSAVPDKELNADGLATLTMQDVDLQYLGGNMNETSAWQTARPLVFADGSTTPPADLPAIVEKSNHIPKELLGVGWGLAALCILLAVSLGIWTFFYRHYRSVRSSQPEFMFMICLGVVIMAASIIPMGLQETNVKNEAGLNIACMSVPWLLTIGFITSFSVLFAKTWRVNKILLNANFKKVTVKLRDVLYPFAVLLLVNVALLSAWTAVVPLVWERTSFVSVDEFGRSAESYAVCQPSSSSSDGTTATNQNLVLAFIIPLLVCNIASVAFTNYQAFRGRKIKMRINESREIFITMSILTQTALLGIPVYLTVLNIPSARFMIYAFLVALVCLAILIPLYVPKLKAWKKEHSDKRNGVRNSIILSASRSGQPTIIKSTGRRRSSIKSCRSSLASNANQGSLTGADADASLVVLSALKNALAIEESRRQMLEKEGDAMLKELQALLLPLESSTATGGTDGTYSTYNSAARASSTGKSCSESDTIIGESPQNEVADHQQSETTPSMPFQSTPEDSSSLPEPPIKSTHEECGKADDECPYGDDDSKNDDGSDCDSNNSSSDEDTSVEDEAEKAKAAELNFYLRRIDFDIHEADEAHPDFSSPPTRSLTPFSEVYDSKSFMDHAKRIKQKFNDYNTEEEEETTEHNIGTTKWRDNGQV